MVTISQNKNQLNQIRNIVNALEGKSSGVNSYKCRCPVPSHGQGKRDINPSLSVWINKDGEVAFDCKAGCQWKDVASSLQDRGLWKAKSKKLKRETARFDYVDGQGKLVFQSVRYEVEENGNRKKEFKIFPSGLSSEKRALLYQLPNILTAKEEQKVVFVVEGEKCVDALVSRGFTATTNAMGAKKWKQQHSEQLENCDVVVIPDFDAPGDEHAKLVIKSLQGIARSAKRLDLPDLKPKGDIYDWFATGHTVEEFELLLTTAYIPDSDCGSDKGIQDYDASSCDITENKGIEFKSALAVIECLGGKSSLVFSQGSFWSWHSKGVWEMINDRKVKQVIHRELLECLKKSKIDSVLDIIKTEVFLDRAFDEDIRAINCLNGELNFDGSKWILSPHVREHYRITQIPVIYNPDASAPRFEQFLDEIFYGDNDIVDKKKVICELLGYSLISSTEFERFGLFVGSGANGKSVLLSVVESLVGQSNVCAVTPSEFENRFQRGHLFGKLANIVSEISEGGEIADAQLKAIVSGDLMTAERKHKPPFDFRPYCTCLFGTNHMPHTRDFSDALFRRAIVVSFNRKFEGEGIDPNLKDPHLKKKLEAELSGILNIALHHLGDVITRGGFSEDFISNADAKKSWRIEADQSAQFVEEECELLKDKSISSAALYSCYRSWAERSGIAKKLNKKSFTTRLRRLGVVDGKGSGGQRMLYGIHCSGLKI